jgi:hypothetical protein
MSQVQVPCCKCHCFYLSISFHNPFNPFFQCHPCHILVDTWIYWCRQHWLPKEQGSHYLFCCQPRCPLLVEQISRDDVQQYPSLTPVLTCNGTHTPQNGVLYDSHHNCCFSRHPVPHHSPPNDRSFLPPPQAPSSNSVGVLRLLQNPLGSMH